MSPMGYSKSPITSAASGSGSGVPGGLPSSGVTVAMSTMTHANNVVGNAGIGGGAGVNMTGMSASYSCTNPYGLKTVVDGGGVNSNVGINSLNAAAAVAAAGGGVGVVSVGGNNALCSSSSLTVTPNVNISGAIVSGSGGIGVGANSMGVIPGEGPPTPTQELDLSGNSSLEQQQRKCKLNHSINGFFINLIFGFSFINIFSGYYIIGFFEYVTKLCFKFNTSWSLARS